MVAACGAMPAAATAIVQGRVPRMAPALSAHTVARVPGWSFQAVATGDVDGDGHQDVIGLDTQRQGVVVARSVGGGRFATRRYRSLFELNTASQLVVGDLDRDGHPDLVTVGFDARQLHPSLMVQVAYGRRGGFMHARSTFAVGADVAVTLRVGDADGDGRPDVLLGLDYREGHRHVRGDGVIVLRSRPGRRFAPRVRPTLARSGENRGGTAPELLAGDLDHDGALDLIARGRLIRGLGGGRFATPVAVQPRIPNRDRELLSNVSRVLAERHGRTDLLASSEVPPHSTTRRLGVVTRGAARRAPALADST